MEINEILADFKRRYEQSYIWVVPPESDEESLFFVNRITEDKAAIANLELSSPEFGKIILNIGTAHKLRFKYPPVGVFQNGTDAFMFRRVPAKQYKHGLYYGNSHVAPVTNMVIGKGTRQRGELAFEDVVSAYKGESYGFKDALHMLASGKYRSVALRRNFSLMLSPVGLGMVLLFWEAPIASLAQDGKLIQLYEKSFESVVEQIMGV